MLFKTNMSWQEGSVSKAQLELTVKVERMGPKMSSDLHMGTMWHAHIT